MTTRERRSRWWRDALIGALVGGMAGIVAVFGFQCEALWLVPAASALGATLCAVFGDRVLPLFHW